HLMISDPAQYAEQFVKAGADMVTFHLEAVENPRPLLEQIRSWGAVAGLAYNPSTPLSAVTPYLAACDLVLTSSVSPGFGGQAFEDVALDKIRELRKIAGPRVLLEVDGGVNEHTIGKCAEAGTDLFVVGSAIFGQKDYRQSVANLTHLAQTART